VDTASLCADVLNAVSEGFNMLRLTPACHLLMNACRCMSIVMMALTRSRGQWRSTSGWCFPALTPRLAISLGPKTSRSIGPHVFC
jgi:hypothetical protein